jgi:hypothetical protein
MSWTNTAEKADKLLMAETRALTIISWSRSLISCCDS